MLVGEMDRDDTTKHPQIRYRRFPVKCIFIGVVGRPRSDKNLDGRIFLEIISKTYTIKKRTANQRFSDDVLINSEIKNGKWRQFYVPEMICDDLRKIVGDAYELEDYIIDRLEFSYKKLIGKKGNAKYIPINNDDELLDDNHFKLSEISLKVRNQEHDTVEKDCSCDSEYMLSAMNRVGEAIRQSFHWVPIDELVYLFIDGAGGHGTKEAIVEYKNNLQENFNIQLVFQVPRTPDSNDLDLGVWCGLQAAVKKTHFMRRCEVNVLVRSVYET